MYLCNFERIVTMKLVVKWYAGIVLALALSSHHTHATQLPREHDHYSNYSIDYSDFDYVLKNSVLLMGPSTHKPSKARFTKITATRLQFGNTKITREEGNRVLMHEFKKPHRAYLKKMRDDLLAIPADLPLEKLSRNDQLAYWLNLHNAIALEKISAEYPVTRLKPFFDKSNPDAFVNQRRFMVNGTAISLRDIQDHVITNWNDPVVIYGFYMGAVGTPNIRNAAFKGESVYDDLHDNAVDFVNSVRGTQIWKTSELRVSTYYDYMRDAFPNFEISLRAHIEEYAKPAFKHRMIVTSELTVNIKDWNIADLYNGRLSDPTGSKRIDVATPGIYEVDPDRLNLIGFRTSGYPHHVVKLLRQRQIKNRRRNPTVEIEELPQAKETDN